LCPRLPPEGESGRDSSDGTYGSGALSRRKYTEIYIEMKDKDSDGQKAPNEKKCLSINEPLVILSGGRSAIS
jgi:hypothetical protein